MIKDIKELRTLLLPLENDLKKFYQERLEITQDSDEINYNLVLPGSSPRCLVSAYNSSGKTLLDVYEDDRNIISAVSKIEHILPQIDERFVMGHDSPVRKRYHAPREVGLIPA